MESISKVGVQRITMNVLRQIDFRCCAAQGHGDIRSILNNGKQIDTLVDQIIDTTSAFEYDLIIGIPRETDQISIQILGGALAIRTQKSTSSLYPSTYRSVDDASPLTCPQAILEWNYNPKGAHARLFLLIFVNPPKSI